MNERVNIISRRLQGMTDRLMNLGAIGAGVAVHIPNAKTIVATGGHFDLSRHEKLTESHLFQIGSQTKIFVAIAVHLLVKRGLISYEDLGENYVPELSAFSYSGAITVANLLTHTSGIGSFTSFLEGQSGPDYVPWPMPEYSFDDLMTLARAHGTQFAPGERMLYCDTGFVVLGEIVERVSGIPLPDFLQSEILDPLGLSDTYIGATGNWPRDRTARGYYIAASPENIGPIDAGNLPNLTWVGAAGDMISSLGDMITFARAMMDPKNPIGISIGDFAQELVNCWDQKSNSAMGPDIYHGPEWGLGIGRLDWGGRTQWGHRGSTFGYRSNTIFDPDNGIAVSCFMTSVLRSGDLATTRNLQVESDSITAAAYFGACDVLEFS